MFTKKLMVAAVLAAGMIGGVATSLPIYADVDIQLNFGPPAPYYEAVPAPRSGYVWAPGNWQWNAPANRHVWHAGTWQTARSGYVYNQPRWVENNGRWHYQASRWDRDGDGIANNRDRTPDGNRATRNDRDGDGIPNYRDATPDGNRATRNDRDGDGIPNYKDRTPDGVAVRKDNDHDGVPNNRDNYPNNPNYR